MPHWMKTTTLAGAVVLIAPGPTEAQIPDDLYEYPEISIAGSTVSCVGVARRDGLWRYDYRLANPASSDAGVESLRLDISASLDVTPVVLDHEGLFLGDGTRNGIDPTASHAPVGFTVPPSWAAVIFPDGRFEWVSTSRGLEANDPVPPGATRQDFVLRSTYLPGVREYVLWPDYPHRCCPHPAGDPRNLDVDVKSEEDFEVRGQTIAPTYRPEQMDIDVLVDLLDRACGELGWISNAGVCRSLRVKLEQAGRAIERGRTDAARGQLESFLAELDARHGEPPGKHVNDDAYWLLRTNAAFLLERLDS